MENETIISLRDIVVDFDGEQVLRHINLDIRNHEFVTLLGPSGCGKTTTLRIIGGFITPNSGDVFFDGKKINSLPPYKRAVNTVFQKYALFPNLNVFENIAFGLRLKKVPDKEIKERVFEMLDLVSMRGYERRDVNSLSGGTRRFVCCFVLHRHHCRQIFERLYNRQAGRQKNDNFRHMRFEPWNTDAVYTGFLIYSGVYSLPCNRLRLRADISVHNPFDAL